jgi:hypothetical protein
LILLHRSGVAAIEVTFFDIIFDDSVQNIFEFYILRIFEPPESQLRQCKVIPVKGGEEELQRKNIFSRGVERCICSNDV